MLGPVTVQLILPFSVLCSLPGGIRTAPRAVSSLARGCSGPAAWVEAELCTPAVNCASAVQR